jgi:hypothetical protein
LEGAAQRKREMRHRREYVRKMCGVKGECLVVVSVVGAKPFSQSISIVCCLVGG